MKGIRWFPAIVGGFLAGLALYLLISLLLGSPQIWAQFVGWALVGWWAGKGQRHAWGRVWLVLALASFALPLVTLIVGARATAGVVGEASTSAEQAGAVIGGAIGTAMLAGFSAFVGFFLGIIFAILAYFGLRGPKTTEPPA